MVTWRPSRECLIGAGVAAAVAGSLYYIFADSDKEETKASDRRLGKPSDVVRLDEDDLDPEERKLIAEVKKKGYYHGRPKSEAAPSPQRIQNHSDDCAGAESDSKRRADFDEFQKKWDRFG
mmetsp:Transcript_11363/g.17902  ORF Transcript_11363/g.17902 Transcript_11363/m.17902 type:complete len:121 (+) Transcript_11363:129-491(+)